MFYRIRFFHVAAVAALCQILVACSGGGAGTEENPVQANDDSIIVSIDDPGTDGVVNVNPTPITGTLDRPGATVVVDGVDATVSGTDFTVTVPLEEGVNTVEVTASVDGVTDTQTIEVTLNTTEMCGAGEVIEIDLPGVAFPNDPTVSALPDSQLPDDTIELPTGCSIYAFLVGDYGRNAQLDDLLFYKLAKAVAENDGYVHWSWWNNFLDSYMGQPLHGHPDAEPSPGHLAGDDVAFTIPEARGKAVPDDDFQFQSDARRVIEAIRAANPDAIIIVAGHGMGGNAAARLGANTAIDIDLLAPIDPVGNRNLPEGIGEALDYISQLRSPTPGADGYTPGNETYNWTRWRAMREFRGYKQLDCIKDSLGVCRDFDDRDFFTEYRCLAVPEDGWLQEAPTDYTLAPVACPRAESQGPIRDSGQRIRFSTNIKRLYHRWQREYFFPYDYGANYAFRASAARSDDIFGANYQAPVLQNGAGESDPDKTCSDPGAMDPRGANSFGGTPLTCQEWDGHGEIVGMRATTSLATAPTNNNLQPLGLKARPFAMEGDLWVTDSWFDLGQSAERKQALVGMATAFDPDTGEDTWPHRPVNPDLDLVVDDLVLILQDIMERGDPVVDVTPPSSSATPDIEPNEHGWNNTDVLVTIAAMDEEDGSGVRDIAFSYSGAESGSGVVAGDRVEILLTAEGEIVLEYFATDNAGNVEETQTLTVRIDKTPPVITATADREPNENGWYDADVTVTFEASDALSGVDFVTAPITVTGEGADQQIVGMAIDRAGNSATAGVIVSIDKTPPKIVGLPEDCTLWPPNHKLVKVAEVIAVDDVSGIADFDVTASSSEPASGPTWGPHTPDIVISDGSVELRAERYSQAGRLYEIAASASDLAGNEAEAEGECYVPHDQGNN